MSTTFREAVSLFAIHQQNIGRSQRTIYCYSYYLDDLARGIGEDTEVTTSSYRDAITIVLTSTRSGTQRSETTKNLAFAVLRSFGWWLVDRGILTENPATSLKIKKPPRRSPGTLTDPECKRLLKELAARKGEAAARDLVILRLFLGTGIRVSELAGLNLGSIDLEARHVTIRAKGGRTETRFLNTDLRTALLAYLAERKSGGAFSDRANEDEQALFLSRIGRRISVAQIQGRFHEWLRLANITRPGLTVHSLRHTFGSRLYRRTKDLVLVGKAMGHRTVEATRIYVHEDTDALESAIETLDK